MTYIITEIFAISLMIALWVNAVIIVTDEGQLLHFIYRFMADRLKLPDWALRPLIVCPQCMCGIHGIIVNMMLYTLMPYGFNLITLFLSIAASIPLAYYIRSKIIYT